MAARLDRGLIPEDADHSHCRAILVGLLWTSQAGLDYCHCQHCGREPFWNCIVLQVPR